MRLSALCIGCLLGVALCCSANDADRSLKAPTGLVLSSGTLYVSDAGSRKIFYRPASAQEFEVFVTDPRFQKPSGLATDAVALYVADPSARSVFRIDKKSREVTVLLRPDFQISPSEVVYLPTYDVDNSQVNRHNILVLLDKAARKIYRLDIDKPGTQPNPWTGGEIREPAGLSRLNHHVLVVDRETKTIFESEGQSTWLNLRSTQTDTPLPPGVFFPELSDPNAVDTVGDIYYLIDKNNVFALVEGGARLVPLTYRADPVATPQSLIVDVENQRLLMTDVGASKVVSWPLLVPITIEVEAGGDISTPLAAIYLYLWRLGVLPMTSIQFPYMSPDGKKCLSVACVIEQGRSLQSETNIVIEQLLCEANEQFCVRGKLVRPKAGDRLFVPLVPFEKYLSIETKTLSSDTSVKTLLEKYIPDQALRGRATEEYLQVLNPRVSRELMSSSFNGLKLNLPIQRNRYYLSVPRTDLFSSGSMIAFVVRKYPDLSVRSFGSSSLNASLEVPQQNDLPPNAADLKRFYEVVLKNMDFESGHLENYGRATEVPVLVAEPRADCQHPVFFKENGQKPAFGTSGCGQPKAALEGVVSKWAETAARHGTCVASLVGARKTPYGGIGLASEAELRLSKTTNINSTTISDAFESFKEPFIVNLSSGNREVTAGQAWTNLLREPVAKKYVLFIAAAGNKNDLLSNQNEYPAVLARQFPNLISVGALDDSGKFIWEDTENKDNPGSNSGLEVELLAPGESVPCAMEVLDGKAIYTVASGTSMGTPLVSVVAALLLNKKLTPPEVKARILATAEPLEREVRGEPLALFGKLSAERALLSPKVLHLQYVKNGETIHLEGELSDQSLELKYQTPTELLHRSEPVVARDLLSIRMLPAAADGSSMYRLVRFDASNKRVVLNDRVHLTGCLPFNERETNEKYLLMFGGGADCPLVLVKEVPKDNWIMEMKDFIGTKLGPDRFEERSSY